MEIRLLADCSEVIPALAGLHQLELGLGERSDYGRAVERLRLRANSQTLPLALVAFADTLPVGSVSLVECDLASHEHLRPC